jgi:hypothetical protein
MIGRIKQRVRDRQPRLELQLMQGRHWLWVSVALCAAAMAAPPPPQPPSPPPVEASPSPGAPDDDFIEFLGADDVGDAAWWEFLKKVPPRGANPPATPPQDAKQ